MYILEKREQAKTENILIYQWCKAGPSNTIVVLALRNFGCTAHIYITVHIHAEHHVNIKINEKCKIKTSCIRDRMSKF